MLLCFLMIQKYAVVGVVLLVIVSNAEEAKSVQSNSQLTSSNEWRQQNKRQSTYGKWIDVARRLNSMRSNIMLVSSRIIKHIELWRLPAHHIELLLRQQSCGQSSTFIISTVQCELIRITKKNRPSGKVFSDLEFSWVKRVETNFAFYQIEMPTSQRIA